MNKRFLVLSMIVLTISQIICQTNQQDFPLSKGLYLGQTPPGLTPAVFAPGIVSIGLEEGVITFMPDGKECYWSVIFPRFETILTSRLENDKWTEPEVASFAGLYYDGWPMIQPDGKRLFFHSSRPNNDSVPGISAKYNIWYMERIENGWSEPKILETPVNGKENSTCPSVTKDGTIYFSKRFSDDTEKICCSKLVEGKYQELEILPPNINSSQYNFHASISPDGSFMIMPVYKSNDNVNPGWNYYFSFRKSVGQWSDMINLGKEINSIICAGASSFSPDGKYFFFQGRVPAKETLMLDKKYSFKELIERDYRTHSKGSADIFWIDSSVIESLKPIE